MKCNGNFRLLSMKLSHWTLHNSICTESRLTDSMNCAILPSGANPKAIWC